MAFAFYNAIQLVNIPNGVLPDNIDYSYCFANCKKIKLGNKFMLHPNTVNVQYMFLNSGLSGDLKPNIGLRLPRFTKYVTGMFAGCTGITDIPYNFLQNANDVEDLSDLFAGCTGLTEITENLVIPVNVKNINRMFKSCTSLKINNMQMITYNNIISAIETFSNCTSLLELPINFKLSTIIINFSGFCFNCISLKEIPESFWPSTYFSSPIINLTNAFNTNNGNLTAILPDKILWRDKRILWKGENAFYNPNGNIKNQSGAIPDAETNNWFRE